MNTKYESMKKEAIFDIIECLENGFSDYYCDLHNEVFNTDYYIVGKYAAEKALNEYGVFDAIREVKDYEKFNFGEIYTDISDPEKLVNMLYYIIGGDVIGKMYDIPAFNDNWDNVADDDTNAAIIDGIKKLFHLEKGAC